MSESKVSASTAKRHMGIQASRRIGNTAAYIVLVLISVIWLVPFVCILLQSFRVESTWQVGYVIPQQWGFDNYVNLWNTDFPKWYMNTLIMALVTAVLQTIIVLCMGVGVAIFAMTYILPKFKLVFDQIGPEGLPPATKLLLGANDWFKAWWPAVVLAIVGGVFAFRRWTATKAGRLAWDGFKLRAPLVKGIVASAVYANFASTLESLLRNGVPILRALDLTSETVGNEVVGAELRKARERVTDGTTISGPLEQGGVFPPMVIDLLAVGERTGDMPSALEHVAKRYESQLEKNILVFTTALEPIMIFAVAAVVGFIAMAIMQAVLSVTSGIR